MRYGSVCSGIEAASVAWEPLGWQPVWFSEIAKFPSKFLAHRYPKVPNHGSLVGLSNRLTGSDRSIDLLVGGTPCQSFSVAGLRGGLADERGNLALEFARLAAALRPRWLLWENVPGVLSADQGRAFASLLGALQHIGYGCAWRVLDAQFFGLAQRRQRVFLVGHLGAAAAAGAVLFEPEGVRRHPPSRGKTGEDVAHALRASSGKRDSDDPDRATFIPESQRWPKEIAPTLNASFGDKLGLENQHIDGGAGWFVPTTTDEAELTRLWAENDARLSVTASFDETQVTSRTNRPPSIAFNARQDPVHSEHTTGALDTDGGTQAVCVTGDVARTTRVRRLTPRECERLQGFPDGWTDIPGASDSARYAALGNSMAVPVMAHLGRRIAMVDRLLPPPVSGT